MKKDPYKHEEKYRAWKEQINKIGFIEGITRENSDLILSYVFDMELGMNVSNSSKKGSRSYIHLNTLKQRMISLAKRFEEHYKIRCITELTEHQIIAYFAKMRNGEVRRVDGKRFKAVIDYVKIFKSFWHWHMKVSKKQGVKILDITEDLDCSKEKPQWVYLDENQVKQLYENAKYNY